VTSSDHFQKPGPSPGGGVNQAAPVGVCKGGPDWLLPKQELTILFPRKKYNILSPGHCQCPPGRLGYPVSSWFLSLSSWPLSSSWSFWSSVRATIAGEDIF